MKKLLVALTLSTLSITSFAADIDFEAKIVCQEYNPKTERVLSSTISIIKTGAELPGFHRIPQLQFEASKTPAQLIYYKNGARQSYRNTKYINGYIFEEDVNYVFKSKDGKTVFKLWLDEMDQGDLRLEGARNSREYFCN